MWWHVEVIHIKMAWSYNVVMTLQNYKSQLDNAWTHMKYTRLI
jgi:hypothetical protein